jgi:hypothetical protein
MRLPTAQTDTAQPVPTSPGTAARAADEAEDRVVPVSAVSPEPVLLLEVSLELDEDEDEDEDVDEFVCGVWCASGDDASWPSREPRFRAQAPRPTRGSRQT